jgi:hypothetical protein
MRMGDAFYGVRMGDSTKSVSKFLGIKHLTFLFKLLYFFLRETCIVKFHDSD